MYIVLVRPHVEYASAVDPHLKKDVKSVETIQRQAARIVKGEYSLTQVTSYMYFNHLHRVILVTKLIDREYYFTNIILICCFEVINEQV